MAPVNTNNTAKLKYDIFSYPTGILHANNPQHTLKTIIKIIISNPTPDTPISLEDIKINLPVGIKESDLLYKDSVAADISISIKGSGGLNGLEVTASDIFGAEDIITAISIIIEEKDGDPFTISNEKITLTISDLQINEVVGHAEIKITEEPEQGDKGKLTKDLSKWPTKFEFENFNANDNYILVPPGEVKLTWDGTPYAVYRLFYPESRNGIEVKDGKHTVKGLSEDTIFRLEAIYHKDSVTLKKTLITSVKVEKPYTNFIARPISVNFEDEVTLSWTPAPIDSAYKVQFLMHAIDIAGHAEVIEIDTGKKSIKFPIRANTTFRLEAEYSVNGKNESYIHGQETVGCTKKPLTATIEAPEKCYIDANNTEIKVLLKNTTPNFKGHLLITSEVSDDIRIDIARTKMDFEVKYTLPKFYAPVKIELVAQDFWNGKIEEATDSEKIELELKDPKKNLNFAVFFQEYTSEYFIFDYYLFYEPEVYYKYFLEFYVERTSGGLTQIAEQTEKGLVYKKNEKRSFSNDNRVTDIKKIGMLFPRTDASQNVCSYSIGYPFKGTAKFKVSENDLNSFKFELDYKELKPGQIIIEVFDILATNKLALIHQASIETKGTSGAESVEFTTPFAKQHFNSKKINRKIVLWACENSEPFVRRRIESKVFEGE